LHLIAVSSQENVEGREGRTEDSCYGRKYLVTFRVGGGVLQGRGKHNRTGKREKRNNKKRPEALLNDGLFMSSPARGFSPPIQQGIGVISYFKRDGHPGERALVKIEGNWGKKTEDVVEQPNWNFPRTSNPRRGTS